MKGYILVFSVVTGAGFGWIGDELNFDILTNTLFSGAGSIAGCFLGYWIYKKILG
jgi:hypothetical protein